MEASFQKPTCTLDLQDHQIVLSLDEENQILELEVEDFQSYDKYKGNFAYSSLPNVFHFLFENIREFYDYLANQSDPKILIQKGHLVIMADVVGKLKEYELDLQKMELSAEEKMFKEIRVVNAKLSEKDEELLVVYQTLKGKDQEIEAFNQILAQKESENTKLRNRIRQLEDKESDLMIKVSGKFEEAGESRTALEYTPPSKRSPSNTLTIQNPNMRRKYKESEVYGKRVYFKIDERCKYFQKFKIHTNEVEKLHGPTYQLYHHEPLPKEGKFYFDIKVVFIKNNNIVVGVISEQTLEEQFSFKKPSCVCYNGYDGSICQGERQAYVSFKPKEGNKIRTVVEMSTGSIQWYMMYGEGKKNEIGKTIIPAAMLKQSIFPYFELYWEGNKVKLNGF